MSVFLSSYTKALKSYDRELFAGLTKDGLPCVFRKHKHFEIVCEDKEFKFYVLKEDRQYVCAITENWSATGKPRDWGIDDVLGHIKAIDYVANQSLIDEMDEDNERVDESKQRSMRNDIEGFWSYERRRFAKATDDILTHSLSKYEPRKRLKDRSIKNGNC